MMFLTPDSPPQQFQRNSWMEAEIRRIGRARFLPIYWPALDKAISTCLESQSYILPKISNHSAICPWQFAEPGSFKSLAGFILVCPPHSDDISEYGLSGTPLSEMAEVAFLAVDTGEEGKGYAKLLLKKVVSSCLLPFWLHVDTVNIRAKKLYESLGMIEYVEMADPYGSPGFVMVHLQSWRYSNAKEWPTLLNSCHSESEHSFCRRIFPPPLTTSN